MSKNLFDHFFDNDQKKSSSKSGIVESKNESWKDKAIKSIRGQGTQKIAKEIRDKILRALEEDPSSVDEFMKNISERIPKGSKTASEAIADMIKRVEGVPETANLNELSGGNISSVLNSILPLGSFGLAVYGSTVLPSDTESGAGAIAAGLFLGALSAYQKIKKDKKLKISSTILDKESEKEKDSDKIEDEDDEDTEEIAAPPVTKTSKPQSVRNVRPPRDEEWEKI